MLVQTTILVNPQDMERFRLEYPHLSFSQWVREQMRKFLEKPATPKQTYAEAWEAQKTPEPPNQVTCPQGSLKGLTVRAVDCAGCRLSCNQRLTPANDV